MGKGMRCACKVADLIALVVVSQLGLRSNRRPYGRRSGARRQEGIRHP
jgi:hypothetical protein